MGVKHYDKAFKEQAIKLREQRGSVNSVSRELGIFVLHTTVAKYMHMMGLASRFYPKYCTTTDSNHSNSVEENLLDRNFNV